MDNFLVDLNHLELLAVEGEDSGKFLQGQLTCDVDSASDSHWIHGAACNNKGRVLTSFLLVRRGDTHFLEMKPGLLAGAKANLDKYIVFSKAETDEAGDRFHRLGLMGTDAGAALSRLFSALPTAAGEVTHEDGNILLMRNEARDRVPPRYELWIEAMHAPTLLPRLRETFDEASFDHWELQDIRLGEYWLDADHVGEYTPQPLNYDQQGHVSFSKGCYTGQEIVARMHYRGSAKKRLYPVRLPSGDVVDQDLRQDPGIAEAETGKKAGEILKVLRLDDGTHEGLALLGPEAVANGTPLVLAANAQVRLEPIDTAV